jgi:sulfatase modifying factor 1
LKRFLIGSLILACASLVGGCATNTRATRQRIHIQSAPPGANVLILPSGEKVETPASVELRRDTALTLFVEKEGYRSTRVYLDRETDWWALLPYTDNLFHLVPNPVNIVLEPESADTPSTAGTISNRSQPADESNQGPSVVAMEPVLEAESHSAPLTAGSDFNRSQPAGTSRHAPAIGTPEPMKVDKSAAIATHMVPAGAFASGCNELADSDCFADEKPGKDRELDAFEIDATEVTVAAFRDCVSSGECTEPESGNSCNWGRSDRGWHPLNCVDWKQANAYCKWKGKRLPTEWEWEKAARGTDGRKYPWGDEAADCDRAVIENEAGSACGQGHTTFEVGSKPSGLSPYGVLDMAGNVWEWTSSTYSQPSGQPSGRPALVVVRGGSWFDTAKLARVSFRGKYADDTQLPSLGFRCVLSLEAAPATPIKSD